MAFNSLTFAAFFVVTYAVYLLLQKHHKFQNRWLLAASCFFYGWWDWRFLFLMAFTIGVDYWIAHAIERTEAWPKRKILLSLSVACNLTVLGFFKYFNFFMDSLERLTQSFGFSVNTAVLPIVLPLGISFYTFQAMSYVVDVYRRQLKPAENFLDYAAYISYFPQLVAGPIERGAHLLPQILKPRVITQEGFYQGCYLIFWGLFQKMFVADNLGRIVDPVFALSEPPGGLVVLIAMYAFALQIYCDFSGYSDIARGLGKCMGFDIMINFNLPYFATNPMEFWKRWHISLSTWLRDYLYIPLGGNQKGKIAMCRSLILTMLMGGLWHGAQWTFVVWGAYHGLLLIFYRMAAPFLKALPPIRNRTLANLWFCVKVIFFFHLLCFGWLLFRAQSLSQARQMLPALFRDFPYIFNPLGRPVVIQLLFFSGFFLLVQGYQYFKNDLLAVTRLPFWARWGFYYGMLFGILLFGVHQDSQFIYFQF